MKVEPKAKSVFRLYIVLVFWLVYFSSFVGAALSETSTNNKVIDPAYMGYDYGSNDRVIRIGSQPLGVLHSVIPEVLSRDRILEGYLRSNELELRIFPFFNGPDINHYMRTGKIDAAMAGDFPTLSIASSSQDVEVTAFVKRDRAAVVTRKKYRTLKNLVGKRIAYPAGTSSHLGLLVVLEAAGISEEDVIMVPMKVDQLTQALVEEEIDAYACWEPIPTNALNTNRDFIIVSQFLNTDYFYWTEEFSTLHPGSAKQLLAAYIRAINWLNENDRNLTLGASWSLKRTADFLRKGSAMTVEQFKRQVRKNLSLIGNAVIPSDEFTEGSYLNRAFSLLHRKGLFHSKADWEKVEKSLQHHLLIEIIRSPTQYRIKEFDYQTQ